ncbi:hypothetical protein IQ235_16640 [Oscillatoriales cyanobacterium LEGE 11467]|uniref:Uncharacterized protein n=1 Tax=Zarconia navalis LEGE 11467 TaxID=1828826 RepID=A0A928ZB82_9CYAN|nr:hypothetical protein [Zarconia navalis]MBE9042401.1 hypothetical protein [Zarconia navalis LEGE 11467]
MSPLSSPSPHPLAYLGSQWLGAIGIFAAACFSNIAVGLAAFLWSQKTCNTKAASELEKPLPSA